MRPLIESGRAKAITCTPEVAVSMIDPTFVFDWRHVAGPLTLTAVVIVIATTMAFVK